MQLWIGLILATYQQLVEEQPRHLLHLEYHHPMAFRDSQMPAATGCHVGPHLGVEPPILRRRRSTQYSSLIAFMPNVNVHAVAPGKENELQAENGTRVSLEGIDHSPIQNYL